jgi:hypothetical protein
MLFPIAEKLLSPARLFPYKQAAKGDEQASLNLYLDNLRIAQSFYAPLSLLEVTFRNALHDVLAISFGADDWLLTQQAGFMVDPTLTSFDSRQGKTVTNNKVLTMVQAATTEYRQKRNAPPPNGAALIAELTFGFWTTLFSRKYFFLLNRNPLRAFAHRPRGTSWETISNKLTEVRTFRNRVYHYEPLCFQKSSNNVLCFSQLNTIHRSIIELLSWIDPSLPTWLTEADRVPDTLKKLGKKHPLAS